MMGTIKNRLKRLAQTEGLSMRAFEETWGLGRGNISNMSQEGGIGSDKLTKIIDAFPMVDLYWLLTGEGDMLKSDKYEPFVEVKPIHHPRSVEKKEDTQVVYLYDFEAAAGLKTLFDNKKNNIIDTIKIPKLPKCDGAIHIVGDSMYPLLKSGDIILYREISPSIENIVYGEMYLLSYDIDGDDYVVVKYIRKSERGEPFITLGSENPDYASRDIDFHRITAIAIVKASVRINCIV
ncbi:MAG: S24 family peptidase [Prevotella salivae]|nr:S24 family peptidase [Segatella salivae]